MGTGVGQSSGVQPVRKGTPKVRPVSFDPYKFGMVTLAPKLTSLRLLPKLLLRIVTRLPTGPEYGERETAGMLSGLVTVNV